MYVKVGSQSSTLFELWTANIIRFWMYVFNPYSDKLSSMFGER